MTFRDEALRQLERLIQQGQRYATAETEGGWLATDESVLRGFRAAAAAAVERVTGRDSEFYRNLPPLPDAGYLQGNHWVVQGAQGILVALHEAVKAGELERLEQRVRANVEDDFLEQGSELLASGYQVAAMVLVGGVLEDRLHNLCVARGLSWTGNGSLAKYNDALHKANVLDQPVWRRIQGIGDVRNGAAHGGAEAAKVKSEDVEDALNYVRRFLADYTG